MRRERTSRSVANWAGDQSSLVQVTAICTCTLRIVNIKAVVLVGSFLHGETHQDETEADIRSGAQNVGGETTERSNGKDDGGNPKFACTHRPEEGGASILCVGANHEADEHHGRAPHGKRRPRPLVHPGT